MASREALRFICGVGRHVCLTNQLRGKKEKKVRTSSVYITFRRMVILTNNCQV